MITMWQRSDCKWPHSKWKIDKQTHSQNYVYTITTFQQFYTIFTCANLVMKWSVNHFSLIAHKLQTNNISFSHTEMPNRCRNAPALHTAKRCISQGGKPISWGKLWQVLLGACARFFPRFFLNTKKRPYITTLTATLGRELPGVLDFCIFLQRMKKYMRGILVLAASEWLPNWQLIHIVDEVRDVVLTSEHCENNGKHTFHADIRISIRAPAHQTQAHWRNLHDTTRSLSFD